MFDYVRYGDLPYEIQIMILKMGLEHPIAKIIKDCKKSLPKPIIPPEQGFIANYFMFQISNGEILGLCENTEDLRD
tara:strand:+ start:1156 stop:1383 length:228 start_codon:yes stop_codon:yes gene_type:complete